MMNKIQQLRASAFFHDPPSPLAAENKEQKTIMRSIRRHFLSAVLFLSILVFCCACGKEPAEKQAAPGSFRYEPGKTRVLVPEADGAVTVGSDPLILDFSHADQGYFSGTLMEPGKKINIQLTGPDNIIYKYFLDTADVCTTFPFTAGDGDYLVLAFENIGNDQYASLFSYSLSVQLENEFLPFLYPNQYVFFTDKSAAVQLASEITADCATDLDALQVIYGYVTGHITYDDEKAATVETGYLPDIDETLRTGTGICFDYAALTAAMLRSLSIPARLEIGYSSNVRHAWIDVFIESVGWVEHAVEFNGKEWKLMDPTFAAAAENSEEINEYIGDGSNYTLQYIR